ncbi:hypothetical protein CAI16_07260 [Virgibacillus dokdonensis]|uniref:Endospore appendages core domain-containing protein n=1 Tax=Virgibacillus dokdonensis TaxID=302167 RepID=A0A3E0WUL2_9BACI|nr:S-Ena type endospore appendage [Virgibacillus dokdonensis]RFA35841.1 hypothetical protein CAI16_07260 [Virgibacillus dokdonensis]
MSNSCLGSASSLTTNTELMKTNVCHSIRHICDGVTPSLIFTNGLFPEVNGIFTVTNSSTNCTTDLTVVDANGTATYTIAPQSSVAVTAETLTSITYTCTGPDPTAFCTGSFEANFYYCVDC